MADENGIAFVLSGCCCKRGSISAREAAAPVAYNLIGRLVVEKCCGQGGGGLMEFQEGKREGEDES